MCGHVLSFLPWRCTHNPPHMRTLGACMRRCWRSLHTCSVVLKLEKTLGWCHGSIIDTRHQTVALRPGACMSMPDSWPKAMLTSWTALAFGQRTVSTRCCSCSLRTATMSHPATLPNLDTRAHTHVRARAHTHTHAHRNPMGSRCFTALRQPVGSFTYHGMPCHAAHTHSDPGDPRRHAAAHGGTQHAMPRRPRPQRSRRPAAAHGSDTAAHSGTRHTADSLRQRTVCNAVTSPRRPRWPTAGPQLESLGTNARRATPHQGPTRTLLTTPVRHLGPGLSCLAETGTVVREAESCMCFTHARIHLAPQPLSFGM